MASGRTRMLAIAALVAALLGASAYVAIPTPWGVPFTLQVLVVVLAGLVLRPAWALAAVGVYVVLGAIGVPVFAGAQGGLGVLVGPTGGYLVGFLAAAPLIAMVRSRLAAGRPAALADGAGAAAGLVAIYGLGWLQLSAVTGLSPAKAFVAGVVPYILADAVKAVSAAILAQALRRAGVVTTAVPA